MTAPAEDPRGGEACKAMIWPSWAFRITPCPGVMRNRECSAYGWQHAAVNAPSPAAGRGDTDSGGEGDVEMNESSRHEPAGDRAQPTQELREAIRWKLARRIGSSASACADDVLALPEVAALLDAQAAVNRVEALAADYAERAEKVADGFWKRHLWIVSQRLRAALDGTTT